MTHTLAAPRTQKPNRRPHLRVIVSDALRSAADRIAIPPDPHPRFRPGDPSPCCGADGEKLFPSPWLPGSLVCSNDGEKYPAAAR
jgi:hypothetical protein